jgi:transposase-like protein
MKRKSTPNKRSPEREQIIFNALRHGATMKSACKQAGISKTAFEQWRAKDPQFAHILEQIKVELKAKENHALEVG